MKAIVSVDNDKDFREEVEKAIDNLILNGLVEVESIDSDTGEFLYTVSSKLTEAVPDIQEEIEKMFLETLDDLWVKGFVSMDRTHPNPKVNLTDLAFDKESVSQLSYKENVTLTIIMDAMRSNGEI